MGSKCCKCNTADKIHSDVSPGVEGHQFHSQDCSQYSYSRKVGGAKGVVVEPLRPSRNKMAANQLPEFLKELTDLAVKVGTKVRLLVEVRSSSTLKVSWYQNETKMIESEGLNILNEGNLYCIEICPIMLESEGRWTCVAENLSGRSTCSCHLRVIVPRSYKAPEFVQGLRAVLTEAGTVSLECKVVGIPAPTLKWFKDNKEIKAGDIFALTASTSDPTSLGTYTCEASNCMGRSMSSSKVHIQNKNIPVIIQELVDHKARVGEIHNLAVTLIPPYPSRVEWYNKDVLVPNSESKLQALSKEDGIASICLSPLTLDDDGDWKVVLINDEGLSSSSSCQLSIVIPKNYRKPRFLENLKAVLTEEGLVSFECKVVGFPTPHLYWFKDGHELRPGDVYQLSGTNSLGVYSCVAKNCMGVSESNAELTLEDIQHQLSDEDRKQLLDKTVHPPRFSKGLQSIEGKINEKLRLSVESTEEITITWYRENDVILENDKYRISSEAYGRYHLDIENLELVDEAEWKCLGINEYGHSMTSCRVTVIVPAHYRKPKFLEPLRAVLSNEGTVNLECKVIGVPQPQLKWYKDGVELKAGDIHKIISGEAGSCCCLGTYTCSAFNCMGTISSSAALLGFEEKMLEKKPEEPKFDFEPLSTIAEERSSQMLSIYETPSDKSISLSIDGKELSVSLYETPDLTENDAKQIVEMFANQCSESVSEQNVLTLPSLRFMRETSTSGRIVMEAVVIDVTSFNEFDSVKSDQTENDFDEISEELENIKRPLLVQENEELFDLGSLTDEGPFDMAEVRDSSLTTPIVQDEVPFYQEDMAPEGSPSPFKQEDSLPAEPSATSPMSFHLFPLERQHVHDFELAESLESDRMNNFEKMVSNLIENQSLDVQENSHLSQVGELSTFGDTSSTNVYVGFIPNEAYQVDNGGHFEHFDSLNVTEDEHGSEADLTVQQRQAQIIQLQQHLSNLGGAYLQEGAEYGTRADMVASEQFPLIPSQVYVEEGVETLSEIESMGTFGTLEVEQDFLQSSSMSAAIDQRIHTPQEPKLVSPLEELETMSLRDQAHDSFSQEISKEAPKSLQSKTDHAAEESIRETVIEGPESEETAPETQFEYLVSEELDLQTAIPRTVFNKEGTQLENLHQALMQIETVAAHSLQQRRPSQLIEGSGLDFEEAVLKDVVAQINRIATEAVRFENARVSEVQIADFRQEQLNEALMEIKAVANEALKEQQQLASSESLTRATWDDSPLQFLINAITEISQVASDSTEIIELEVSAALTEPTLEEGPIDVESNVLPVSTVSSVETADSIKGKDFTNKIMNEILAEISSIAEECTSLQGGAGESGLSVSDFKAAVAKIATAAEVAMNKVSVETVQQKGVQEPDKLQNVVKQIAELAVENIIKFETSPEQEATAMRTVVTEIQALVSETLESEQDHAQMTGEEKVKKVVEMPADAFQEVKDVIAAVMTSAKFALEKFPNTKALTDSEAKEYIQLFCDISTIVSSVQTPATKSVMENADETRVQKVFGEIRSIMDIAQSALDLNPTQRKGNLKNIETAFAKILELATKLLETDQSKTKEPASILQPITLAETENLTDLIGKLKQFESLAKFTVKDVDTLRKLLDDISAAASNNAEIHSLQKFQEALASAKEIARQGAGNKINAGQIQEALREIISLSIQKLATEVSVPEIVKKPAPDAVQTAIESSEQFPKTEDETVEMLKKVPDAKDLEKVAKSGEQGSSSEVKAGELLEDFPAVKQQVSKLVEAGTPSLEKVTQSEVQVLQLPEKVSESVQPSTELKQDPKNVKADQVKLSEIEEPLPRTEPKVAISGVENIGESKEPVSTEKFDESRIENLEKTKESSPRLAEKVEDKVESTKERKESLPEFVEKVEESKDLHPTILGKVVQTVIENAEELKETHPEIVEKVQESKESHPAILEKSARTGTVNAEELIKTHPKIVEKVEESKDSTPTTLGKAAQTGLENTKESKDSLSKTVEKVEESKDSLPTISGEAAQTSLDNVPESKESLPKIVEKVEKSEDSPRTISEKVVQSGAGSENAEQSKESLLKIAAKVEKSGTENLQENKETLPRDVEKVVPSGVETLLENKKPEKTPGEKVGEISIENLQDTKDTFPKVVENVTEKSKLPDDQNEQLPKPLENVGKSKTPLNDYKHIMQNVYVTAKQALNGFPELKNFAKESARYAALFNNLAVTLKETIPLANDDPIFQKAFSQLQNVTSKAVTLISSSSLPVSKVSAQVKDYLVQIVQIAETLVQNEDSQAKAQPASSDADKLPSSKLDLDVALGNIITTASSALKNFEKKVSLTNSESESVQKLLDEIFLISEQFNTPVNDTKLLSPQEKANQLQFQNTFSEISKAVKQAELSLKSKQIPSKKKTSEMKEAFSQIQRLADELMKTKSMLPTNENLEDIFLSKAFEMETDIIEDDIDETASKPISSANLEATVKDAEAGKLLYEIAKIVTESVPSDTVALLEGDELQKVLAKISEVTSKVISANQLANTGESPEKVQKLEKVLRQIVAMPVEVKAECKPQGESKPLSPPVPGQSPPALSKSPPQSPPAQSQYNALQNALDGIILATSDLLGSNELPFEQLAKQSEQLEELVLAKIVSVASKVKGLSQGDNKLESDRKCQQIQIALGLISNVAKQAAAKNQLASSQGSLPTKLGQINESLLKISDLSAASLNGIKMRSVENDSGIVDFAQTSLAEVMTMATGAFKIFETPQAKKIEKGIELAKDALVQIINLGSEACSPIKIDKQSKAKALANRAEVENGLKIISNLATECLNPNRPEVASKFQGIETFTAEALHANQVVASELGNESNPIQEIVMQSAISKILKNAVQEIKAIKTVPVSLDPATETLSEEHVLLHAFVQLSNALTNFTHPTTTQAHVALTPPLEKKDAKILEKLEDAAPNLKFKKSEPGELKHSEIVEELPTSKSVANAECKSPKSDQGLASESEEDLKKVAIVGIANILKNSSKSNSKSIVPDSKTSVPKNAVSEIINLASEILGKFEKKLPLAEKANLETVLQDLIYKLPIVVDQKQIQKGDPSPLLSTDNYISQIANMITEIVDELPSFSVTTDAETEKAFQTLRDLSRPECAYASSGEESEHEIAAEALVIEPKVPKRRKSIAYNRSTSGTVLETIMDAQEIETPSESTEGLNLEAIGELINLPQIRETEIISEELEPIVVTEIKPEVKKPKRKSELEKVDASEVGKSEKVDASEVGKSEKVDASKVGKSEKVDVSKVEKLKKIDASEVGKSEKVDASEVEKLKKADASEVGKSEKVDASKVGKSEKVDVSKVEKLKKIDASEVGKLEKIDASEVGKLKKVDASEVGKSEKVDASEVEKLKKADASEVGKLEKVDVSEVGKLEKVGASEVGKLEKVGTSEVGKSEKVGASDVGKSEKVDASEVGETSAPNELEVLGKAKKQEKANKETKPLEDAGTPLDACEKAAVSTASKILEIVPGSPQNIQSAPTTDDAVADAASDVIQTPNATPPEKHQIEKETQKTATAQQELVELSFAISESDLIWLVPESFENQEDFQPVYELVEGADEDVEGIISRTIEQMKKIEEATSKLAKFAEVPPTKSQELEESKSPPSADSFTEDEKTKAKGSIPKGSFGEPEVNLDNKILGSDQCSPKQDEKSNNKESSKEEDIKQKLDSDRTNVSGAEGVIQKNQEAEFVSATELAPTKSPVVKKENMEDIVGETKVDKDVENTVAVDTKTKSEKLKAESKSPAEKEVNEPGKQKSSTVKANGNGKDTINAKKDDTSSGKASTATTKKAEPDAIEKEKDDVRRESKEDETKAVEKEKEKEVAAKHNLDISEKREPETKMAKIDENGTLDKGIQKLESDCAPAGEKVEAALAKNSDTTDEMSKDDARKNDITCPEKGNKEAPAIQKDAKLKETDGREQGKVETEKNGKGKEANVQNISTKVEESIAPKEIVKDSSPEKAKDELKKENDIPSKKKLDTAPAQEKANTKAKAAKGKEDDISKENESASLEARGEVLAVAKIGDENKLVTKKEDAIAVQEKADEVKSGATTKTKGIEDVQTQEKDAKPTKDLAPTTKTVDSPDTAKDLASTKKADISGKKKSESEATIVQKIEDDTPEKKVKNEVAGKEEAQFKAIAGKTKQERKQSGTEITTGVQANQAETEKQEVISETLESKNVDDVQAKTPETKPIEAKEAITEKIDSKVLPVEIVEAVVCSKNAEDAKADRRDSTKDSKETTGVKAPTRKKTKPDASISAKGETNKDEMDSNVKPSAGLKEEATKVAAAEKEASSKEAGSLAASIKETSGKEAGSREASSKEANIKLEEAVQKSPAKAATVLGTEAIVNTVEVEANKLTAKVDHDDIDTAKRKSEGLPSAKDQLQPDMKNSNDSVGAPSSEMRKEEVSENKYRVKAEKSEDVLSPKTIKDAGGDRCQHEAKILDRYSTPPSDIMKYKNGGTKDEGPKMRSALDIDDKPFERRVRKDDPYEFQTRREKVSAGNGSEVKAERNHGKESILSNTHGYRDTNVSQPYSHKGYAGYPSGSIRSAENDIPKRFSATNGDHSKAAGRYTPVDSNRPSASQDLRRNLYNQYSKYADAERYNLSNGSHSASSSDKWKYKSLPSSFQTQHPSHIKEGHTDSSPYLRSDWHLGPAPQQEPIEWKSFEYQKQRPSPYDPNLHFEQIDRDFVFHGPEWSPLPRPEYTEHDIHGSRIRETLKSTGRSALEHSSFDKRPGELSAEWAKERSLWEANEEMKFQARQEALEKTKQNIEEMKMESQRKVQEKRLKREAIIEQFSKRMQQIEDSKPVPEAIPGMPSVLKPTSQGYSCFPDEISSTRDPSKRPRFSLKLQDRSVSQDSVVKLTCTVLGHPLPQLQFYKNGLPITSDRSKIIITDHSGVASLNIMRAAKEDMAEYTCLARNMHGRAATSCILLVEGDDEKKPQDAKFTRPITETQFRDLDEMLLECSLTGNPSPRVQWLRDGHVIIPFGSHGTGRYSATITMDGKCRLFVHEVKESDSGEYSCVARNDSWTDKTSLFVKLAGVPIIPPRRAQRLDHPTVPHVERTRASTPVVTCKAPFFIEHPDAVVSVREGDDLVLMCRVGGDPKPRVNLYRGCRDVSLQPRGFRESVGDSVRFILRNTVLIDAGRMTLEAKNLYGVERFIVSVKILKAEKRARSMTPGIFGSRSRPSSGITDYNRRHYASGVPGKLSEPIASELGPSWVSLRWTRPESNSPILAYKIEAWDLSEGARWVTLGMSPIASFEAFHLRPRTEYLFRVTPRNRFGWGESVATKLPVCVRDKCEMPDFVKMLPSRVKVLRGLPLSLNCEVRGTPTPVLTWLRDGIEIPGESGESINVPVESDFQLTCQATNSVGHAASFCTVSAVDDKSVAEADLLLRTSASTSPQFVMRLRDRKIQVGHPVRLTCQVEGSGKVQVKWEKDTVDLSDSKHSFQDKNFFTLELPNCKLEDMGVYTARASNEFGQVSCSCSVSVCTDFGTIPRWVKSLRDYVKVAEGGTIVLEGNCTAWPNISVKWFKDANRLRSYNRRFRYELDAHGHISLVIQNATVNDTGIYSVIVENELGSIESICCVEVLGEDDTDKRISSTSSISEKIPSAPRFLRKPMSVTVLEGDTVVIECSIEGHPKPEVVWLRDWLNHSYYKDADHYELESDGDSEYRLVIPCVKIDYTGSYTVSARNSLGSCKAIVVLGVNARTDEGTSAIQVGPTLNIPKILQPLQNMRCSDGDSITFTFKAQGEDLSYIWDKDGKILSSAAKNSDFVVNGPQLTIVKVYGEDEGVYSCKVFNQLGEAKTKGCLVVDAPITDLMTSLAPSDEIASAIATSTTTPTHRKYCPLPPPILHFQRPPKFFVLPHNRIANQGDNVRFQCSVSDATVTTWEREDRVICPSSRYSKKEDDDVRVLEILNVTLADAGVYRITLENHAGRVVANVRLDVIGRSRGGERMRAWSSSPVDSGRRAGNWDEHVEED